MDKLKKESALDGFLAGPKNDHDEGEVSILSFCTSFLTENHIY
ncbi:MAG: hypothetical protein WCL23_05200 [Candidatus Moraniibacteriota bacterium]